MHCNAVLHEPDLFRKWVFGDTSDLGNVGFVLFYLYNYCVLIRCSIILFRRTYAGRK